MTVLYLALYAVLIGMAIWSPKNRWLNGVLLFILSFVLACPAWRVEGPDRDIYLSGYDGTEEITERSFSIMREFALAHNVTEQAFFWIYAFIAIAVVMLAIYIFNRRIWWCVLVYYSYFYILHPMIQIRASCSIAFFLLAVVLWHRWMSIPAFAGALFWHSSSALGIGGYIVARRNIRARWIIALVVASIVLYYRGFELGDIISRIPIDMVREGFVKYNKIMDAYLYEGFNALGLWKWFQLSILMVLLLKRERITRLIGTQCFLNLWAFGLCFGLLAMDYPVLANRGTDLFCTVEIFLLPVAAYSFLGRLGLIPTVVYCLANTGVNVLRVGLLTTMHM